MGPARRWLISFAHTSLLRNLNFKDAAQMKTINGARHLFQDLATLSAEQRELFEKLLAQQGEDLAQFPIPARDPSTPIPLSYPQERVWTISQLTPDSSVDNVPVGFRILGAFNLQTFEKSIQTLIQRNEILRTRCAIRNQQVTQCVQLTFEPWIKVFNLCSLPESEKLDSAVNQATELAQIPFDLTKDLLLRAAVFCLGAEDFVVLLVAHQFVTDGLSFRFLLQELATLYRAIASESNEAIPLIPVQYADFSLWQKQWFTESIFASHLSYWQKKLYEAPAQLSLPIAQHRQFSTQKGASEGFKFSSDQSDQFRTFCREKGVTTFMGFVALFQTVLQQCTQQNDISLGTLISNRNRRETEKLIGNFSNNLLLRTHFTDELNFVELLEQVRDTILEAYNHQDLPFQYLFNRVSNIPKFQALILLRNSTIAQSFDLPKLNIEDLEIDLGLTRMELNLDITDDGKNSIFGKLEYKTDLFDTLTIQHIIQNFKALLDNILQNPNQKLVDILLPVEIQNLQLKDTASIDRVNLEQNLIPDRSQPLTSTQKAIADIWAEVLNVQYVGLHDDFFALGGHSLQAVKLFAEIEQRLGKKLPLSVLFQAPTVQQQDSMIYNSEKQVSWSPLVTVQAGDAKKIPLFCLHGGGFNVLIYRQLALKLDADQPVYGLQARGLDGSQPLHQHFESIAADYLREIQTIQPEGPYMLAGLSNGGTLAFEIAQQLHAQGQKVILLALFDTYGPNSVKLLPPVTRALSALYYCLRYLLPRYIAKVRQTKSKDFLVQTWMALKMLCKRIYSKKSNNNLNNQTKDSFFSEVKLQKEDSMFSNPDHIQAPNILERALNRFSGYILRHSPWAFFTPSSQLQEMDDTVSGTLKSLEAHYSKVIKAYVPKPYTGRIVLFKAKEFPPGMLIDSTLGWTPFAMGGIDSYAIPGHHVSILEHQKLADQLQLCIKQSQQDLY
jgi:thioesterase domain-containing protein/acyl carrier protein